MMHAPWHDPAVVSWGKVISPAVPTNAARSSSLAVSCRPSSLTGVKRPVPDAARDTFASVSLTSHILTYLDVSSIVRARSASRTFYHAAAQPATWAHTVWQPALSFTQQQMNWILQYSVPHLHTLILTHGMLMSRSFDASPLTSLQSVQLRRVDYQIARRPGGESDWVGQDTLAAFLQQVQQHGIRLTHLSFAPDKWERCADSTLDLVLAIPTLQQVTLRRVPWKVHGRQIDKYIPLFAKRGLGIKHMEPWTAKGDYSRSLVPMFTAAMRQAHHCSVLHLSYIDVRFFQAYLDEVNTASTDQLSNAATSKLKHFKLSIIDGEEIFEAKRAGLIPSHAEDFDCNYNGWMHVFLSHHSNIETVEVESPRNAWSMTDALHKELLRLPHLQRLIVPECIMSEQQRSSLKHLFVAM